MVAAVVLGLVALCSLSSWLSPWLLSFSPWSSSLSSSVVDGVEPGTDMVAWLVGGVEAGTDVPGCSSSSVSLSSASLVSGDSWSSDSTLVGGVEAGTLDDVVDVDVVEVEVEVEVDDEDELVGDWAGISTRDEPGDPLMTAAAAAVTPPTMRTTAAATAVNLRAR